MEAWKYGARTHHLLHLPLLSEVPSEVFQGSEELILKNIGLVQSSRVMDEKSKARSHNEI